MIRGYFKNPKKKGNHIIRYFKFILKSGRIRISISSEINLKLIQTIKINHNYFYSL